MSAIDREPFPRMALIGAAALVGVSIIAAAAGRIAGIAEPPPLSALPAPEAQADLVFLDRADGAVEVRGGNGALVEVLEPGGDAFIRGVMRGFVRERRVRGIGPDAPFSLMRLPAGRLLIADPQTGKRVDLRAFGVTNMDAFARLLTTPRQPMPRPIATPVESNLPPTVADPR